ncbi:hypothetical protein AWJ20_2414 [Sugiyamaella lignohabitans]|uniref:Phytase-like domain-containing protein n=1 Tax=Sugiyamaella lignohabitans TaxID=796027 RepID=A0A167F415_9ASCO|nr:uncharacterized protein AWJ20_2414 [Sugiyamaella lignohabitans]ANB14803.1 hypothetical protein AWJ20_2414 [Sugiyamaella lignohabitans]
MLKLTALASLLLPGALAAPAPAFGIPGWGTPPAQSPVVNTVKVGGNTFTNHGLVGAGSLPSDLRDQFGDTIGGIGSAIAFDQFSFKKNFDGSYSGVLYAQPDRGWNTEGTTNYHARVHEFSLKLNPYYGQNAQSANNQISLNYQKSTKYSGPNGIETTGLDAGEIYTSHGIDFPAAFLPNSNQKALALDLEGLVHDPRDGSFWVSDEYGPYIYHFDCNGRYQNVIVPPDAYIPYINGVKNFTGNTDPDVGRESNHGFEGLSISSDGRYLYALLQAALVQDGGTHATREEYTRLVKYDISNPFGEPKLEGEYVVVLPQFNDPAEAKNPRTGESSELHFINDNQFLYLPRDSGRGQGQSNGTSIFRNAEIFDISSATNIAGSKYDNSSNPVAPDGKNLDSGVVAATGTPFVNYDDSTQLARVGMQNSNAGSSNDLDEKWESLALVPTFNAPNDYFLFTMSDNDFITQNGYLNGQKYKDDSGLNMPTQILAFWVTLGGVSQGVELVE